MSQQDVARQSAEELAAKLAQLEEQLESGTAPTADPTIANLKAELDTFVAALRRREPSDFASQTECARVTELVQKIGRNQAQGDDRTMDSAAPTTAWPAEGATMPLRTLGVYELLVKLGEGGMGAVYKARHTRLDKIVAIKILPADRMKDQGAVARFEREMRAVGKLDHPNIVRAMDAGEATGTHYLVMEYVQGMDLSQVVKQSGPLAIPDACEIIRQAAVGLEEAREHGMVHRDIKPSNLMLCMPSKNKPPVVKVLDMGLALLSEAYSPDAQGLTTTGQMMGTLDYMAPEQGGDSHDVDIRADIYSLGVSLYKLLCGEVIYHGEKYQTPVQKMMALATEPAPPLQQRRQGIPDELAAVVHRMLEKSPANRFRTPEEVVQALTPFCVGANLAGLMSQIGLETSTTQDSVATHPNCSRPDADTGANLRPQANVTAASSPLPPTDLPQLLTSWTQASPRRSSAKSKASSRGKKPPRTLAIGGGILGLGAIAALAAAVVFFFQTPRGTLRVEINDPAIQVQVQGTDIVLKQSESEAVILTPGEHALTVKRGDFSFNTDKFELTQGETTTVKVESLPGKVRVALSDGSLLKEVPLAAPPVKVVPPQQPAPSAVASSAPQRSPQRSPQGSSPTAYPGRFALWFPDRSNRDGYRVEVPSLTGELISKGVHHENWSITLECWVKRDRTRLNAYDLILGWGDGSLGITSTGGGAFIDGGEVGGRGAPPIRFFNITAPTKAQKDEANWMHVAAVLDRNKEHRLYINGKLVAREASPMQPFDFCSDDSMLKFGERAACMMGEARISTVARYDKDFTPEFNFKPDKATLALYRFDEGQGDLLQDSSGNNHHGKLFFARWAPVVSPAVRNYGLRPQNKMGATFESLVPTLPLPSGPMTLEGYIYVDGTNLGHNPYPFGWEMQCDFHTEAGKMLMVWHLATGKGEETRVLKSRESLVPGAWHHLAATRTGDNTYSLYVNGLLQATLKDPAPSIGAGGYTGRFRLLRGCDGMVLREIRVSNVVRYSGERFTPAVRFEPDGNTLALFHCDEVQGKILNDSSGHGHDGDVANGIWEGGGATTEPATSLHAPPMPANSPKPTGQPAAANYGLRAKHPGRNGPGYAAQSLSLELPTGPLTLEGYVFVDKLDYGPDPHPVGWFHQNFLQSRGGVLRNAWIVATAEGNQQREIRCEDKLSAGVWHHLAATRDADNLCSIYLDGVRHATLKEDSPYAGRDRPEYGRFHLMLNCDGMVMREVRVSNIARYTERKFTPATRFEPDDHTLALFHCDEGKGDVLKDSSGHGHDADLGNGIWEVAAQQPSRHP